MSTLTKYFCDRCNTALELEERNYLNVNQIISVFSSLGRKPSESWDLCLKCIKEIMKFIGKKKND